MKTFSPKPTDISRKWLILDASQTTMGRVATAAASLLIGKAKPTISPHMDGGDHVIIINTDQMPVSGGKEEKKMYHRHSGFPGGLHSKQMKDVPSDQALFLAIRGMLPVNKLRDGRLARLKIYKDAEHKHAPQQPQQYSLKGKR